MTVATAPDRRARLLRTLAGHRPVDPRERRSRERMLALVRWLPRPFDQDADPTHVTASALVTDGRRVVLHRHKRLGRWMQPGGHVDPGEHPAATARRETAEETGLAAVHPPGGPRLLHVDVHEGGRGHLHLDLRYLLCVDPDARFAPAAGESPAVAWFDVPSAVAVADEALEGALRSFAAQA